MKNTEQFFKEMFFNIWQSNDISKIADYYAEDFEETISVTNDAKQPLELGFDYV